MAHDILLRESTISITNALNSCTERDDKKPLESEQIRFACYILNTADYCGITTLQVPSSTCCNVVLLSNYTNKTCQLEERLRDKIDEEWKDKVDLQAQRDNFLKSVLEWCKDSFDSFIDYLSSWP